MHGDVASDRFLVLPKILPGRHDHDPDFYVSINVVKPHHGFFLCFKQV